jgi:hypothetical protein
VKWIRLDTSSPAHPLIHQLSIALKIPSAQAFGHYCSLCCGLGEHQEDGQLAAVPDAVLEVWAAWRGRTGRFALVIRELCQQDDGRMKGWWRQEKLRLRAEKDRDRHREIRRPSADRPQTVRRPSALSPHANDTIRNGSSSFNKEELHLAVFENAWKLYPRRPADSKSKARKVWTARVRAGVDPEVLVDGVRRYAAYVTAEHIEPKHVKMASTFFGPDEHYLSDYTTEDPNRMIQTYTDESCTAFTPEFLKATGLPAPR